MTTRRLPPAAFLDRDGTLIRDTGYVSSADEVELLPGAAEAVRLLNAAGVRVVVVTNQSGIGRGFFDEADFEEVQAALVDQLTAAGARIEATYHCPHAPGAGCDCRKPGLKLYRTAVRELAVETKGALYVGDQIRDVLPARALGGIGMLVAGEGGTYDGPAPGDVIRVPDLLTGVREFLPDPLIDPTDRESTNRND